MGMFGKMLLKHVKEEGAKGLRQMTSFPSTTSSFFQRKRTLTIKKTYTITGSFTQENINKNIT